MLTIKGNQFLLDGEPIHIYSGVVHYFRHPREYWRDRLLKLKAAGFNCVETYTCWNMHEPKKGEFHFEDNLDIGAFLDLAQELGLWAIVRPGPYICAEIDMGGLPSWLLKDREMQLRCMYQPYLDAVTDYYRELFKYLKPRQDSEGGPIIAMQVENEYGSYGNDKVYLEWIRDLMVDCGMTVLPFTSDGPYDVCLSGGAVDGIYACGNFGGHADMAFESMEEFRPNQPFMCMEFWGGWYHHMLYPHEKRPPAEVVDELSRIIAHDGNFNYWVFAGGTTFGFYAGATTTDGRIYDAIASTYDDDALLTEWGDYTEKFHAVRKLLHEVQGKELGELPPSPRVTDYGRIPVTKKGGVLTSPRAVKGTFKSPWPLTLEDCGQDFGLMNYRTVLTGNYSPIKAWNSIPHLNANGINDRAHVYVNGKYLATFYRNDNLTHSVALPDGLKKGDVIDVLVEAMGRINYGPNMRDRKGLAGQVMIGQQILHHWEMTSIPLDNVADLDYNGLPEYGPTVLSATLTTDDPTDTFIDVTNLKKGVVFVNGKNIGRYWNISTQQTLYIPGCWLKKGDNEIVAVDFDGADADELILTDDHRLECLK